MRRCKLTMLFMFHNVEEATLDECQKHMGLFVTLTEENLRKLGQEVRDGSSDLRQLPSYAAAMGNGDLMHEVISLMPVLIPEALAIRKDEVRHLIQAAGLSLRGDEEVPGTEEAGVFAEVFPEDTPMEDEDVEQVTPMQEDAVGRAEAYLELLGSLPDRVAGLAGLTTQVMQRHPNDEAAKTEADAEAVEALTFIRERNEKVEEDLKSMQKEVGRDGCGL